MKQIDYAIVIPAFNCAKYLRVLIENIHQNCRRYRPKSILIVDDGSCDDDETKYVANIYSASQLPIRCLSIEHRGPMYAEQAGLDAIDTEYAIIMHSDLRLLHKNFRQENVFNDTLSVLVSYLSQTEDAIAVSAFTLCYENPARIQTGPRSIGVDKLPYSFYKQYEFNGLRPVKYNDWKEVYSCDGAIYALRMQFYHEIRFDEIFAPYLYYHDDFFARARLKGCRTYFTQDAVAFHPRFVNKPANSFSIVNDELYQRNSKLFLDRWRNHGAWQETSLKREIIRQTPIEGRT